ncbi:MAG: phosphatidylserine decarboxylase [Paracoccaceae bacterium]
MKTLFIVIQYLLPQHLLSRLVGKLAETKIFWLKNLLVERFIKQYGVDMSEAAEEDHRYYATFNEFFTRKLKPGARDICPVQSEIACPADGAISQLGDIRDGRIFQAKGHEFSLFTLLGDNNEDALPFRNGKFATVYLSPKDYHRVHMPLDGKLITTHYIPGQLFSVNQNTAENVDNLFARNERLVCLFETPAGPMAMILVGAMIVAGIETVWGGQIAPPPKTVQSQRFDKLLAVELKKGEEMGRFMLGSTVILLFGENAVEWLPAFDAGTETRMGETLGKVTLGRTSDA